MTAVINALRAPARVGGVLRNGRSYDTPEQMTEEWQCKKRDGKSVNFDVGKIRAALSRCFEAVELDHLAFGYASLSDVVDNILRRTLNSLAAETNYTPDVERIQRAVIQQLWSEGFFEAAEHYQNYRERHRLARVMRPASDETLRRVAEDQQHFPSDLSYYQFMSKFSRWNDNLKRRETWREAVYERIMPWLLNLDKVRGKLTAAEIERLTEAMYNLEASPAMRVVQMAGPALDRCHVGAYNCAYLPLCDLEALAEMLYILMQGSGVGFSVEDEYIQQLPRIKKQRNEPKVKIVVEDSTESWCESYLKVLKLLWDGYDFELDTSKVRKKGERLKTKGGRSSGPEPFHELCQFVRNVILDYQGRCIDDVAMQRIACFTGRIVQVGGVRRASLISLSELRSHGMRTIKSGEWWGDKSYWHDGKYLSMSNNSAVYDFDGDIPVGLFMDEWASIHRSKSGERGIFNRQAALNCRPPRRKAWKFGCNPCAEIILRAFQFCNLSIAIAREHDTEESLIRKVWAAAVFGKMQATATKYRYIRKEWKENCEEERLLGVDINGHADCPLLRYGAPGREQLMRRLKAVVDKVDEEFSIRFDIPRSAANTCIKPSGDSSLFFECASGLSPRFAAKQIRYVREDKESPVARFLIDSGVPHAEAPEDANLLVFGFPRQAPEGCTLRDDLTAVDQFNNWLQWKDNWAEHSVSATIYVGEREWPGLGAAVYDNIDKITGLAFLPRDNGVYRYAPNVELSEAEYEEFCAKFPKIDWSKLPNYEKEDQTTSSMTYACVGGACDM